MLQRSMCLSTDEIYIYISKVSVRCAGGGRAEQRVSAAEGGTAVRASATLVGWLLPCSESVHGYCWEVLKRRACVHVCKFAHA